MNKIMQAGMLALSFSHVMQSNDHKELFCIKKFTEEIHHIINTLDRAFEQILLQGNGTGYVTIEQAQSTLKVHVVNHEKEIQMEEAVSFLNSQIESIVQFIQNRPTTKDKVISYMMQFKNKIDLINLISVCIGHLNTMYQTLVQKGHKKDAVLVRQLIIYATEVRSKWVNRSSNDPMKMLENLRNSLK